MAKVSLKCNECGKRFKVSPNAADPSCPKCGGVDWEVESEFAPVRTVRYRNYSTGPWDWMEVAR